MKAMILAAGLGKRMRPLTDNCPKPLLQAGGKALIDYHLEALAEAGFEEVVINHAYLGEQIEAHIGDGSTWGLKVHFSPEGEPLETAGGIIKALSILGDEPFAVINGDVACDYPLASMKQCTVDLAHLVMVSNPAHNPAGDMSLLADGRLQREPCEEGKRLTFAGISVLHPKLFQGLEPGPRPLLEPLLLAMSAGLVSGEAYDGYWLDVGTPERLAELDQYLRSV